MPDHDALLEQISNARDKAYRSIGEMSGDVLTPLLNPAFMGGPRWPSLRQGWRTIHRGGNTLIASDGLSDPFDDEEAPTAGFGLEVLLETDEPVPSNIAGTWPFQVVSTVSQLAAGHGSLRPLIERYGAISTELSLGGPDFEPLHNADGRVGVLINVPGKNLPSSFSTPAGDVKLFTIVLLMPQELAYIVKHGEAGRTEVVNRLAASAAGHVSRLSRPSVV